jgi:transposase-like protein
MRATFSESFKKQAVEKAVRRSPGVTIESLCNEWGISRSTLTRWIRESKVQAPMKTRHDNNMNKTEKRPQDWSAQEKLNMVIACGGTLDEIGVSELCREKGIYPYHLEQWKSEFSESATINGKSGNHAETRHLKNENRELKKELRRKEKALAEVAALLVLQKKVSAIWGDSEDDLL